MITANGKIKKKAYCSNCFSIICWDDANDEKTIAGHRSILCPFCGSREDVCNDAFIEQTGVIDAPKAYVNGIAYESSEEAIAALKEGDTFIATEDITLNTLTLTSNTFDLKGHNLTVASSIVVTGNSVINDGIINVNSGDGIAASNNAYVTLNNIDLTTKRNGVTSSKQSELILNNCKIKAQEAGLLAIDGGTIKVNGGEYETIDNGVIMTNGSAGRGKNHIIVNGGTFTGKITSAGYLAHVIYAANDDTIEIKNGTFEVENGSAIVVRGGKVVIDPKVVINASGDVGGKVGDGKELIPAGHQIVVDTKSKYPAVDSINVVAPGKEIFYISE